MTAPCRCARAACRDCAWAGLAVHWPDHHSGEPLHRFRPVSAFCGHTPCDTVAAELVDDAQRAIRGEPTVGRWSAGRRRE